MMMKKILIIFTLLLTFVFVANTTYALAYSGEIIGDLYTIKYQCVQPHGSPYVSCVYGIIYKTKEEYYFPDFIYLQIRGNHGGVLAECRSEGVLEVKPLFYMNLNHTKYKPEQLSINSW